MENERVWTIEKTNFSFVEESMNPSKNQSRIFFCVGDDAYSFLGFLDEYNSQIDSYDISIKDARGDQVGVIFSLLYSGAVDLFDPLNVRKTSNTNADQATYIAIFSSISSLQHLYEHTFPLIFKSTPTVTRQFILFYFKRDKETENDVTPEQIQAAAEFIGASRILKLDRIKFCEYRDQKRETEKKAFCEAIALQSPSQISYTDNGIVERFKMLSVVSFGQLKQIQKQLKLLDPNFTDPVGNNLLHYAVQNTDDVFYYVADLFPELLNLANLSTYETPVHKYIQNRREKIDWDRLWKLPIKFSKKLKNGNTCLALIEEAHYSAIPFEALIKNEAAWSKARKHHKRKIILTKVVHRLLRDWKTSEKELKEKVEFFIKNGASIHHHDKKSLLNSAIKYKHLHIVILLLELGAKIREEDIIDCWLTGDESMVRFMLNRPEMNLLSQDTLNYIAQTTVKIGFTDILRALIRKGCKIDLKANQNGRVVTANLLAQMHCSGTIIPLKYQCVDVIYESMAYRNRERNKVLMLTGDEAQINWDYELKSYPEEIRDLFRRKELWRWALFLEDEERREKICKLYQATNRKIKDATNKHTIELHYGSVTFCFSFDGYEQFLWLGDLKSKSPKHRMFYKESDDTYGGGYTESYYDKIEDNKEVLEEVMKTCGWDLEDVYVFLHILHTSNITAVDYAYLSYSFFTSYVYQFRKPPQWYADFVQQVYGLTHPRRQ